MSELLSSITGGSGKGMVMPQFISDTVDVGIKDGLTSTENSTTAGFYAALELDYSSTVFDVTTLSQLADQLEQTIIDTGTGFEGVLTQILGPRITAGGTVTIRVYADSDVFTFTGVMSTTTKVLCIGDFVTFSSVTTAGSQYGGANNPGYSANTDQTITMLTPTDTASRGMLIGIPHKDSLKVTVQGSLDLIAGGATTKCSVSRLTYLPKGIE